MRYLASFINEFGNSVSDKGHSKTSMLLYHLAAALSPSWSVPLFNLGLREKHLQRWQDSLSHNQRAVTLNADDQGAWWNLAIAATALRDWNEAVRAWEKTGLQVLEIRDGKVFAPCGMSCVRIDPNGEHPEVVWGDRLDPARIRIANVPLPRSRRRYGDIILNDGSEEGTRTSGGEEYPVFDELDVWEKSAYSTFSVALRFSAGQEEKKLTEICEVSDVAMENWGSLRMLCEACSRGNPGEHVCANKVDQCGDKMFGFAAASREALENALDEWKRTCPAVDYSQPRLELLARTD